MAIKQEPIDRVVWRACADLKANDYNPNVVIGPELRLIEHSILSNGWLHPVVIDPDLNIIDGFHRWTIAQKSKALIDRHGAAVPTVTLEVSRREAMAITVRLNRAKGVHVAVRMADLVRELIDTHGLTVREVATEIGGTVAEVNLLYQKNLFKALKLDEYEYSKAWVPYDDRKGPAAPAPAEEASE